MQIITANELLSGAAVYLCADGSWRSNINEARLFGEDDSEIRDQMLAISRKNNRLVSVESENVVVENGNVVAHRLRERIRSEGPTAPRMKPQELKEGDHVSL